MVESVDEWRWLVRPIKLAGAMVVVVFALIMSGCGGSSDLLGASDDSADQEMAGVEDSSPSDEADEWSPPADSPDGYGAIEKFNEFSMSFMATMVKNLNESISGLGFSTSKSYFGSFKDVNCGCEASAEEISCQCTDTVGGSCSGLLVHSDSSEDTFLGMINCADFYLDADTIFDGVFSGRVWVIPLALDYIGDGYGGFFAGKEVTGEGSQCSIGDDLSQFCSVAIRECVSFDKIASIGLEVGDEGFSIRDACGDFVFGPQTEIFANFCLISMNSFYTTFKLSGVFNGEQSYVRNNIECSF